MKTPSITPNPTVLARPTATLAAIILAISSPTAMGDEDPCIVTARFMYAAGLQSASADYSVALAIANNEATADARINAAKRAEKQRKKDVEAVNQQFAARKKLCHELGEDRYNPKISPKDFLSPEETAAAPNPLFPLVPGTTYHYRSVTDEGTETVAFEITHRTRKILGVTCTVVHDAAKLDGSLIEDTDDWFAQDRDGNVWYFGESTAEYEGGLITSTEGSWEAGADGAKPGMIMFAKPKVGKTYRQELSFGNAEDAAEILALDKTVTVPAGTFSNCLKTRDFTPLEPDASERKYYAPGIGTVLEVDPATGNRMELISVEKE